MNTVVKIKDFAVLNRESYSKKYKWNDCVYLDTGNITNNCIDELVSYNFSETIVPSRARRIVQKFDIVYSTVRPNQMHFGILVDVPENLLVSTGFTVMSIDSSIADPFYIYYYITQSHITNYLQSIAEQRTSTYPTITPIDLANIEVLLPPLPEQKAIAQTLSCLDDKIENNRRIIANLEAQAEALYKSWFVDFEPFADGEFEESELGSIPKGWKVGTLGECCSLITKGTTPKNYDISKNLDNSYYIKAESIGADHHIIDKNLSFIDKYTYDSLQS